MTKRRRCYSPLWVRCQLADQLLVFHGPYTNLASEIARNDSFAIMCENDSGRCIGKAFEFDKQVAIRSPQASAVVSTKRRDRTVSRVRDCEHSRRLPASARCSNGSAAGCGVECSRRETVFGVPQDHPPVFTAGGQHLRIGAPREVADRLFVIAEREDDAAGLRFPQKCA